MKTLKPLAALLMFAGSLLSGCLNLTPPATAAQAHGLKLAATSSICVRVNGPRLQMNQGNLELAGSVAKQSNASFTAFSHLDILFYDDTGRIVETKSITFSPRSVGHSRFASQVGYYALKLDPPPAGTAKIEVRAHDGDLATPHG